MGNVIASFFSGLGSGINKLLGSPLDFLAGKNCSSACGPTWDLFCYIDNFCIAHLLKLATVSVLVYFVLLFFYLIFQLGICQCICHTICRVMWACFSTWFSILEYFCTFLCYKLPRLRRVHKRHKRDIENLDPSSTDDEEDGEGKNIEVDDERYSSRLRRKRARDKASYSRHWRNHRGDRVRRLLRPKSQRIRVRFRGESVRLKKRNSIKYGHHGSTIGHDIRVTQTSKFAHKGGSYKASTIKRRKK